MERDSTMTRRFLADAGIVEGMRVLEVGCGRGEVTEVLARLVGPAGHVLAVDRDAAALDAAGERVRARGLAHVTLVAADVAGDLARLEAVAGGQDAIAGRRVLMYLPDPAAVLRRLAQLLRPGGLAVFEESDLTLAPGRATPLAAHDEAVAWLARMLVAEGASTGMGFALPAALAAAGFQVDRVRAEAVIQGQPGQLPLATLVELVADRIVAAGIADRAGVAALACRIREERQRDPDSVYVSDIAFCASGRRH